VTVLGESLEGLLLRYIDAHLQWAPLSRAAHAECAEKFNGADLGDLSHNELQAAIRLLSRITERNGCDVASDRATALADEIEPLVDAIVAAEASTLAGLRTKALAALWEARPSSTYGGIEFPDDDGGASRSLFDAVAALTGLTPMVRHIEARLAAADRAEGADA
jgi:hypothetical protein